jgi:hypothetical protein
MADPRVAKQIEELPSALPCASSTQPPRSAALTLGLPEVLRLLRRALSLSLPVKMDDGSIPFSRDPESTQLGPRTVSSSQEIDSLGRDGKQRGRPDFSRQRPWVVHCFETAHHRAVTLYAL